MLAGAEGCSVRVRNALGQTVSTVVNGTMYTIEGGAGVYLVEIKQATGRSAIIKMVKE